MQVFVDERHYCLKYYIFGRLHVSEFCSMIACKMKS